ncbi:M4 family metallopeptidase [Saccharopolyspora phatthalungensis]|uniref:Neutral metalloproteinase n=1 Tax=Saccharopolyspora phatthalungensis TaxID=664693 RepID=A0A840PZQ1_9PSEU|nr:M4 family metallopeptidase [Saccharopolyspora phatthalungensis]MBB5153504.1 Zn-dependent metalloprotease [Saccharopolyspora phatthalungensis]
MRRTNHHTCARCSILPQYVLTDLAVQGDEELRATALRTIGTSVAMRTRRTVITQMFQQLGVASADLAALNPTTDERKSVYDAQHGGHEDLAGVLRRNEGGQPVDDEPVNQAFDNADHTHDFYRDVYQRNSVDGEGMELVSSVHFGTDFDNAFWNGLQMVYGDGSGLIMAKDSLTRDVAVVAHEITHGIVQFTAGLRYSKQSGALNESIADVFGSMVKQYLAKETPDEADWLIGEGILGSELRGQALRSMKAPGTAFDQDRQPARMDEYVDLPDDNDPRHDHGGVHINSGIPNKAFYLVATTLGGYSWEQAGHIWYHALTTQLRPSSSFAEAAEATTNSAVELYGAGHDAEKAVHSAWKEVGVL